MREALFYHVEGQMLHCDLCPRKCVITEGNKGFCRSRQAINGKLYAVNYAQAVSLALDPIEKKPLYHYHPYSQILSLGPNSCNLACSFCQNWEISQEDCATYNLSIQELAKLVYEQPIHQVAFTYSEPTTWYEYICDFSEAYPDIDIVLVTNGYLSPEPWAQLLKVVKAMNIDLKSMREEFYHLQCQASLAPILRNIKAAYQSGIHIELTNLLIHPLNDSPAELNDLASFVASLDPNIPLHISAYRPYFRLSLPATTSAQVKTACDIAARKLNHVYAGNLYLAEYSRKF